MPAYRFTYPQAREYPELRDASGCLVGLAEPGDRRIFDNAPDHMWTEVTSGDGGGEAPCIEEGGNPGGQEGTAGEPQEHAPDPETPSGE